MTATRSSRPRAGIAFAALVATLTACATKQYPRVSMERGTPVVMEGVIRSARQLAELPSPTECQDPQVVCINADPPPFELRIDVLTPLYGTLAAKSIAVATTSHYGMQSYLKPPGERRIFFVVMDVAGTVLPRYHSEQSATDIAGAAVVPLWNRKQLWWLPCGVEGLRKPVTFAPEVARELTGYHDSFLRDHPEDYLVKDGSIVPRYGIYLADVAQFLADKAPTARTMKCEVAE